MKLYRNRATYLFFEENKNIRETTEQIIKEFDIKENYKSVERNIYNLEQPKHYEYIIKYLNRLSDYFYSLSRTINRLEGGSEILWQPSK